ncbi:MAG: universal stress protein [Burkholderiaceae bacterium]
MFKHLPVPADGSPLSAKATQEAVGLTREAGARIATASMAEPFPYVAFSKPAFLPDPARCEKRMHGQARRNAGEVAEAAKVQRDAGVPGEARLALSFRPCEEIAGLADDLGCNGSFMASRGRNGVDWLFAGSATRTALSRSTLPAKVFR